AGRTAADRGLSAGTADLQDRRAVAGGKSLHAHAAKRRVRQLIRIANYRARQHDQRRYGSRRYGGAHRSGPAKMISFKELPNLGRAIPDMPNSWNARNSE